MRKLFLMAGAGALAALGAPAAADAKPGKGKGHAAHVVKVKPAKVKVAKVKPAKAKVAKAKRVWLTACPPGLVWRGPSCVPPGHAVRLLAVGTRVPVGWSYTPWGALPLSLRSGLDDDFRYIQRDGFIYAINPPTRRIVSVIAIP